VRAGGVVATAAVGAWSEPAWALELRWRRDVGLLLRHCSSVQQRSAPAISPRGLTPTVAANSGAGGAATDGADAAPALSGAAALRCHLYGVSGVADRLDARAAAAADAGGAWPGFFGLAHTMGMAKVGARGAVSAADGGSGRMKRPPQLGLMLELLQDNSCSPTPLQEESKGNRSR